MSNFWDERFSLEEYVYGTKPNVYFKTQLDKLKTGKILLPCEGEGRNAVYAAIKGWQVDAFDTSIEGKKKALNLAEKSGLSIRYDILSAVDYKPEPIYDAVGLTFCHFPPEIRGDIHKAAADSLLPGGIIILEAFNKKQIGLESGGPKDINMLFSISDLKNDFSNLEILQLEECTDKLDEGAFHSGEAHLIRLLAKKKAS